MAAMFQPDKLTNPSGAKVRMSPLAMRCHANIWIEMSKSSIQGIGWFFTSWFSQHAWTM
jgi:hypothetical protein